MAEPPVFEVYERTSRFREERFEHIHARTFPWLVKGVLPLRGLAFLAGPSKAGKTFVAIDIALRIATGDTVFAARTRTGSVLYVGAEDPDGLRFRIETWRRDRRCEAAAFSFFGSAPDLRDEDDYADLEATILAIAATRASEGDPLRMVVIDTLAQAIAGADENSSTDMGPVLRRLQGLARALDCLVLVVAHTGKDETRGIRGWSGQLGNADAVIMVDRGEGEKADDRHVIIDKVKNAADGRTIPFFLAPVRMDADEDGDEVWGRVAHFEDEAPARTPVRTSSGQDAPTYVLSVLKELVDAGHAVAVPLSRDVPTPTVAIPRGILKDRLAELGLLADDDSESAFVRRVNRYIDKLVQRKQARATRDFVWPL